MEDLAIEEEGFIEINLKKKKDKMWNAMYIKAIFIALFVSMCSNMLSTSLPLYIQQLGGDKSVAGMVMGVFTIAALVCRPLYGNLVDTKGRKIVLIIGISIFSLAGLGLGITTSIIMILVLRAIQGVGMSGFSTSIGTLVADVLPPSRLSEGVGFFGVSYNISTALGPGFALLLISLFGYLSVFISSFVICIVGLLLVLTFNYEKKAKRALQAQEGYVEPEKAKLSLKTAFEKTAIPGSISQFFLVMPMGFAMTFMPTFGIAAGIENVGTYFTVFALTILSTRFFVGKLADRYGASKVIIPGIILVLAGTLILVVTKSLDLLLISGFILGLGYGCINPTVMAFIMKVSPISRRGAANATYNASFDAGVGFGAMLGGVIVQAIGFPNTFLCLAGVTAVGFALFLKFFRKQILQCEFDAKQVC